MDHQLRKEFTVASRESFLSVTKGKAAGQTDCAKAIC